MPLIHEAPNGAKITHIVRGGADAYLLGVPFQTVQSIVCGAQGWSNEDLLLMLSHRINECPGCEEAHAHVMMALGALP